MYLRYIPKWAQYILPQATYDFKSSDPESIFLTFDDGPIPEVTEYVLDTLKKYNAQATFFCVGDNVRKYPQIFQRILEEGHRVGNHTYHHLDGYKTPQTKYYKNVLMGDQYIQSPLFRPPYGHIRYQQAKALHKKGFQLILWSLLTADFDLKLNKDDMWAYIQKNMTGGDILVLHDNIKSFEKLKFVLPLILDLAQKNNWSLKTIPENHAQ